MTYDRELSELFTLNNGLQIDTAKYCGDAVDNNRIYVRVNNKKMTYFNAQLVYTCDDSARNGWAGLFLGWENYARQVRWGDNPGGVEVFAQKDNGKGTAAANFINGFMENVGPTDWTATGVEHTLNLIVTGNGICLYVDGQKCLTIPQATLEASNFSLKNASIGFFFTNAQFTAKSFSYSPLNAAGEEYTAVESVEIEAAAEAELLAPYTVSATVSPANASLPTVNYELPAGAIANGNTLYFTKAGKYTIKAYSVDNPAIFDEIEVTVKESDKYVSYNTASAEEAAKGLDLYTVTNAGKKDGAPAAFADQFVFNGDGSMTVKDKWQNGTDSGYRILYLKDLVNGAAIHNNSFEISYLVKGESTTPDGWHGVAFVMNDRTNVPNQEGISAFIQESALKGTIWGSGKGGVGGPFEIASLYTKGQWNLFKVKVYGGETTNIEVYVNDMTAPVISQTGAGLPLGDVAIFTTTTISIANINYALLDDEGNAVKQIYPESVTITNAITEATVGDKFNIDAAVAPAEATEKELLYTSSNALVAAVNSDGQITFLNAGTTVITVKCVGNQAVLTEMTVNVKAQEVKPTSVAFAITPTDATVGGKYNLLVVVLPEDATNYDVTYESSNPEVASVDASGRLQYLAAGTTVITVKCVADPTVTASFELTVKGENGEIPGDNEEPANGGCSCGGAMGAGLGLAVAVMAIGAALLKKREN